MGRIAIIIELEPHPQHREELMRRLQADARETLTDDGCLRMEVLHVSDGSGRLVLSELWRDRAAIEAHRAKPGHSHAWQDRLLRSKRTLVCETAEARDEARFDPAPGQST
jgi:quinol monooxygenase YgiN